METNMQLRGEVMVMMFRISLLLGHSSLLRAQNGHLVHRESIHSPKELCSHMTETISNTGSSKGPIKKAITKILREFFFFFFFFFFFCQFNTNTFISSWDTTKFCLCIRCLHRVRWSNKDRMCRTPISLSLPCSSPAPELPQARESRQTQRRDSTRGSHMEHTRLSSSVFLLKSYSSLPVY